MNFIHMMTEKDAYTENGALTSSTTHNFNLDLFFIAGATRNMTIEEVETMLIKSYSFDRVKTLKIIFWAGDIRQGAGERRFFTTAIHWLYKNHKEDLYEYLSYVPEFSRWDVLFEIDDDRVHDYLIENIKAGNSLLCKWLPRKVKATDKRKVTEKSHNTETITIKRTKRSLYKGIAGKLMKRMGLNAKQWRKLLVGNTNVVEQKMCKKEWSQINYEHVPSVAMNKYNKAWYRNDKERFEQYIESVKKGDKKINASAIFPHDIIGTACWNRYALQNRTALNDAQITQWNNLPNYLGEDNSILPICDVSGSMTWENNGLAMKISLSLGLYLSERNKGKFKDAFITFSNEPTMQYLKGDIHERLAQLLTQDWDGNTNLFKVFELILNKAVTNRLSQDEMPKTVLIISDMEFDNCGNMTNFESIKKLYADANYEMPNIAFWNVNGRPGNCPVTINNKGIALISGASPSIVKAVLGDNLNPVSIMDSVIESERYSFIK